MPADKRMLFVRNIERLRQNPDKARTTEYQIIADAHIVGELTYGPYYFTIWEFSNKLPGEERWLCLQIREAERREDEWKSASETGFYHGGGIAAELVALASLLLRRRLKLSATVRMDDKPRMFSSPKSWSDKDLISGNSNLADLEQGLKLVEGLRPELHESFVLAVRLYQEALDLVESTGDLAYLNLVSAIEVLAQDYSVEPPSVKEFDAGLAALVERVQDRKLRDEILDRLVNRERSIARKFKKFILDHIEDNFWTAADRPERGRIEPAELPEFLDRIYKQRSRTLHTGEPFPPNAVENPPLMGGEVDRCLGLSVGERKWEPSQFIPHVSFFEQLVNHVLKTYLTRNQS